MTLYQSTVCGEMTRREQIEQHPSVNGLDYVEVVTSPEADNERVLCVYFIPKESQEGKNNLTLLMQKLALAPKCVSIEGGVRVRHIQVLGVTFAGDHLEVRVSEPGDFSNYTLVVNDPSDSGPSIDPFYSEVQFNFKAGCPSHFDCRAMEICPAEVLEQPVIDYMAKDFASFRRALLDCVSALKPSWTERHEADIGMVLLEALAHTGDQLSYYQDAVSNELYLETARQRLSVRRLARLVDYQLHDGASARTFIHLQLAGGTTGFLPAGSQVLTRIGVPVKDKLPPHGPVFTAEEADAARRAANVIFETLTDVELGHQLNSITIYTWGNSQCCLPRGTTSVHLLGDLAAGQDTPDPWRLRAGDFLLFEERLGPATGLPADADLTHRQVVRLTRVESQEDSLMLDENNHPTRLTGVTWAPEDRLTFPLCVSARMADGSVVENISVARGNLVLGDHGQTVSEWFPGNPSDPFATGIITGARPFRFRLQQGPLSFRVPCAPSNDKSATAAGLLTADPHRAAPEVKQLEVHTVGQVFDGWRGVPSLLASRRLDRDFVAETENDGRAFIRFGDGIYGLAPPGGAHIFVKYRIGVGPEGNVGAGCLAHVIDPGNVVRFPSLTAIFNPLPALGGMDAQSVEQVKLLAPAAFHAVQRRAVTEEDYAQAAEQCPEVSHALTTFRWTGSWHTVFITIDPAGRNDVPPELAERVRDWVTSYTQAGYDLEINAPVYVPLDIVVDVCVAPYHFRADVEQALLRTLSNRTFPDGTQGFFHPERFSFGEPLYLSRLYAAIKAVQGADSAEVTRFQRWGKPAHHELEHGLIAIDRLEIIRLDNDPNFAENGTLRLNMGGGK